MYSLNKDMILGVISEHMTKLDQADKVEIAEFTLKETMKDKRYIAFPLGKEGTKILNIDTLLYFLQPKAQTAELHMFTGETFKCSITTDDIWAQIDDLDYFMELDNGLLVNMNMVQWYHSNLHRIYFSQEHYHRVSSAACKYILPKVIGKERDLYLQKGKAKISEYSPLSAR